MKNSHGLTPLPPLPGVPLPPPAPSRVPHLWLTPDPSDGKPVPRSRRGKALPSTRAQELKALLALLLLLFSAVPTSAQSYELALPGYHYEFPRDYFSHPAYQTEWWYYTGNLTAPDGHRFGFELTFFRQAVDHNIAGSPQTATNPWLIRDLYMAHLALSDISGHRFYHQERINRAGPGLAGADFSVRTLWNGNWQAVLGDNRHTLQAEGDQFGFTLDLVPAKPPVIHGRNGVNQKAAGAGHASHYISLTRLATSGSIQLNGTTYSVHGISWMDHEFFTESLATGETGWDWLSLQLNDNTELMLYRVRHKDGSIDPYSSATYIDAQGKSTFLSLQDFSMTPDNSPSNPIWTSPRTHAPYPLAWRVTIPTLALDLEITTPLADQELTTTIGPSYWEGSIDIHGTRSGAPISGTGYLELTGYAQNQSPLP